MSRSWQWALISLIVSVVCLLSAGALGSLALSVVCGLWVTASLCWGILALFLTYADNL